MSKKGTIRVVVCEPQKRSEVRFIESGLKSLQKVVCGPIEGVTLDDGCHLYCNEEGKLEGLPMNRVMPHINDIICGSFLVSRCETKGKRLASRKKRLKWPAS
jgi:hypothetical protein